MLFKYFSKNRVVASICLYVLVASALLLTFGVNTNGEAIKYISDAKNLANGAPLVNGIYSIPYIAYSLFLVPFVHIKAGLIIAGFVQVLLSAFTAFIFYRLTREALLNETIAFIFFIVYLLSFPIQKWVFFLYTESFHLNLVIISAYFVSRLLPPQRHVMLWLVALLLLLVLFSRPAGIFFWFALGITALIWMWNSGRKKWAALMMLAVLAGIFALLFSPATTFINPDSIARGEIICQVPAAGKENLHYTEYNQRGLAAAWQVIKNEVGVGEFFLRGCKKLFYFFSMWRPYYSTKINLLLLCYNLIYPLALLGLGCNGSTKYKYLKYFSVTYILLTAGFVFFTCDEWSSRFMAPVFPFILVLAAGGVLMILRKLLPGKFSH